MTERTKEEAAETLRETLKYFQYAVEEAKHAAPDALVKFGILSTEHGQVKRLHLSFDYAGFFEDLALVLDAPVQLSEKDRTTAQAVAFFNKFPGLKRHPDSLDPTGMK